MKGLDAAVIRVQPRRNYEFGVPECWFLSFAAARNHAYARTRLRFFRQAEVPL
jgi:hypothetical protein